MLILPVTAMKTAPLINGLWCTLISRLSVCNEYVSARNKKFKSDICILKAVWRL